MSLNWKRVKDLDPSKAWKYYFQNWSLMPNSSVYIYASKTDAPPSDGETGIRLIGRQILYQDIQPGTYIYFAEENGGIFVCSKGERVKLKNYDIPTTHINVTLDSDDYTMIAVEGSNIAFQNLSKTDVLLICDESGRGTLRLTLNQTVALSFPKETKIILKGTEGNETVSILTQQSIAVTELSDENMELLEDIVARLNLIENAMARKEQLEEVEKRTFWDIWSPIDSITGANTNVFTTNSFEAQVEQFRSSLVETDDIINVLVDMEFTYKNGSETINDHAFIYFTFMYKEVEDYVLVDINSSNDYIHNHFNAITLQRNQEKNRIRFIFEFNENVLAMTSLRTTIRGNEHSFIVNNETFTAALSTRFNIDLFNAGLHFTDSKFELDMLNGWNYPVLMKPIKYSDLSLTVDNTTDNNYNDYQITSKDGKLKISFKIPLSNEFSATYNIIHQLSDGINGVIGLNFIPKTQTDVLSYTTQPFSFDLIAITDGIQSSQDDENSGVKSINGKIWKHTLLGYKYFSDYLNNFLTTVNAKDYDIEIIGGKEV